MRVPMALICCSLGACVGLAQTNGGVVRDGRLATASTRLRLTAEIEPAIAKARASVTLKLKLNNISSRLVRLDDSAPEFDYGIAVADEFGKEPPRTDWGNRLLRGEAFALRQSVVDLGPGQEIQALVEVTKVFQLTPGTYYARVTRARVWAERNEDNRRFAEAVYSDPVRFRVVP